MTKLTDRLYTVAQNLEAGDHVETSEMIDLLLAAANAIEAKQCQSITDTGYFTGFMIGSGDIAVRLDDAGDVDIIWCDDDHVTIHKDYVQSVIEALNILCQ